MLNIYFDVIIIDVFGEEHVYKNHRLFNSHIEEEKKNSFI